MKISTILDHIDSGHMALPEFQRGYVWNRDQVRGLFDSLYRRHPVGGLLVWATESKTASHRGDAPVAAGIVKLLLDGQQRMTSLYGVVRGKAPEFFDGNALALSGLRFHLESETFSFYQGLPQVRCRQLVGGGSTRARRSSTPALPYIARFSVFSRLIWPSVGPLLQLTVTAFLTAPMSCRSVRANRCMA
jgi:Protein of unknown function DUF262